MIQTEEILTVPKEASLRRQLRKAAQKLVVEKNITPPANFETLREMAVELLSYLSIDIKFLNFTIVLIGNETWRDVIAATPYNRRLFLLPQCLRKSDVCEGRMDELGLICAGCRACNIDELLNETELLGYNNLVAEGTTMAVSLVEEGAIDAVIGVTCMEVLKKSYDPVSRAAVPVIGIPLLYNGCKDTQVDLQWLKEDLHQLSNDWLKKPLSVSDLKEQVLDYFNRSTMKGYFPANDPTAQKALSMLIVGGQRMRPLLAVLAYSAYSAEVNEEVKVSLAFIIECFHKASLIHDDIEDDDDFRYDQQTLHKAHGIPVAINVGDYLIGKGYQLLSELTIDPQLLAHAFHVVSTSHVNLSSGQGADLELDGDLFRISIQELESIYAQKTGEAIKVALLLGAIVGGATNGDLKHLERFSDHFGIAYQIRDDLNEFNEGQESASLNHFAYLIAVLSEQFLTEGKERKILEQIDNLQLSTLLRSEGVEEITSRILKQHIDRCFLELDQLHNLKMKLSLYRVMAKIF